MKKLTIIGLSVTAFWMILIISIVYLKWNSAANLELNALGDFLSGLTAPLALLWIVIGYFQQGEELRLNTEALKLQQEELRKQVEETAVLAKNSERQALAAEQMALVARDEAEREKLLTQTDMQPLFKCLHSRLNLGQLTVQFTNLGALVRNLAISVENKSIHASIEPTALIEEEGQGRLRFTGAAQFPFTFEIDYEDTTKIKHKKRFQMVNQNSFKEI